MRIVYTVLNGRVAGGQMICLQILRAAKSAGHQVCLVSPTRGELTDLLEAEGVPVFLLPMARTFHFQRAWQFARFLKSWRADLVHCHGAVAGAILARLGAKIAGVPLISHVHIENKFSDAALVRAGQIWLDNWTARFTDQIVTISADTRQSLIQQGILPDKIRVIPNGVAFLENENGGLRTRARSLLGVEQEQFVVGTVARLCPVKGQREFLLAVDQIIRRLPCTKFVVIGEDIEFGGRYRQELEELAKHLNLQDRVVFVGFRLDAAMLMYAFDVFVLPSWTEGMPVTILEAMAAAKPVIATSVGGVPEVVVDGETGLLVPPRDPDRLAQAILHLLEKPESARRMGSAGRERARSFFSRQQMTDGVMALYQTVVSKSRLKETQ